MHIKDKASMGAVLTQLRESTGKSARATAAQMNVNLGSLRSWEKGMTWPTVANLTMALRFYGETATIGWDPPAGDS